MNCNKKDMLLYAVTDRSWLGEERLYQQVEKALQGGATFVQLREKKLSKEAFIEEAKQIKLLCQEYQVPFVINDDVEIAKLVDADGVHVGQEDMEASNVRELLGENKIIGVSVHNVEEALRAKKCGADYLGAGAVFTTSTKDDAGRLDHKVLQDICGAVSIPVVAIGGITRENVTELKGTGISGVAVVSAIFAQKDIGQATAELKHIMEQML